MSITQKEVKRLFEYDDGKLIRRVSVGRCLKGTVAGSSGKSQYAIIGINFKRYSLHRIIFFYHHGYFPDCVDHIDRDKSNNRIENLRACTIMENCQNSIKRKTNTTGYKGVTRSRCGLRYKAVVRGNGKIKYLGISDNLISAAMMAIIGRNKYHGEFASHGLSSK